MAACLIGLPIVGIAGWRTFGSTVVSRIPSAQTAAGGDLPAAPTPTQCTACNGTGQITQSHESRLPGRITQCALQSTGFLGLGSARIARMTVQNDGDEGGNFAFAVLGDYPGGGQIRHVEDPAVYIAPHSQSARELRFTPQSGMTQIQCSAVSPTVVQQTRSVCPVCAGRGLVYH